MANVPLETLIGNGTVATQAEVTAAQAAAIAASQPVDSDLTAIAALATTAYGRAFLVLADAAAGRTALGLGTAALAATGDFDVTGAAAAAQAASQPVDSDLTAIAALTTTAFGRGLLALIDAAALRTSAGLGTLATQSGTFSGTSSGTNTGDQVVPTFATPTIALGLAAAAGAAATVIRSDATLLAFDATVPVTQAYADVAATGAATVAARRDHVHGMPASAGASFAAPTVALGTVAAAGVAATVIRSDATIVAFDATVPTVSLFGDAAATGAAAVAARRDHLHGRGALGTTTAAVGTSAGGAATTPSKSDHVHATGAGTPSTQAFGDAAAIGAGPAAAMTDHKHAMPASPAVPAAATTVTGPDAFGAAAVVGVGTAFARNDHDHGLPAAAGGGTNALAFVYLATIAR